MESLGSSTVRNGSGLHNDSDKKMSSLSPPGSRTSKRVKAITVPHIEEQIGAATETRRVRIPKGYEWITEGLDEQDPLAVISFLPDGVRNLVAELTNVFPGAAAPSTFTTFPFTVESVKNDTLTYLAAITPVAAAGHTLLEGCIIGPNDGPEHARVVSRVSLFSFQVVVGLGLNAANLGLSIANAYSVCEGAKSTRLAAIPVAASINTGLIR